MTEITNEHMSLIQRKYGDLFWYTAQRIGLDPILHDNEDCVQDMKLETVKILKRFKETKYPDLTIEEIIELPHFDKYLKTSLWNYKNNQGAKITKRCKQLKKHNIASGDGYKRNFPNGYKIHQNGETTYRYSQPVTEDDLTGSQVDNLFYSYGKYSTSSNFNIEEMTERMGPIARDALKDLFNHLDDDPYLSKSVKRTLVKHNVNVDKSPDMVYGVVEEVKRAVGKK